MSRCNRERLLKIADHFREIAELCADLATGQQRVETLTSENVERLGISRRAFAAACLPHYRAGDPRVLRIGKTYVVNDPATVFAGRAIARACVPNAPAANDAGVTREGPWDPVAAKREAGLRPRKRRRS